VDERKHAFHHPLVLDFVVHEARLHRDCALTGHGQGFDHPPNPERRDQPLPHDRRPDADQSRGQIAGVCHQDKGWQAELGTLRGARAYRTIAQALYEARARFGVRFTVQSTQRNHLHLIAEAESREALARAMQGLAVRLAKRLNRLWGRRGAVFADRYHARVLCTPREVRNALAYVLCNQRRHQAQSGRRLPADWVDPFSSGMEFDGWKVRPRGRSTGPPTVVRPQGWLLREGWRRHGLITLAEVPGPAVASRPAMASRPA